MPVRERRRVLMKVAWYGVPSCPASINARTWAVAGTSRKRLSQESRIRPAASARSASSAAWAVVIASGTGGPFPQESLNVEQHVGASMTVKLRDGTLVEVTYERSAATHGEELSLVSVDGDLGSVTWSWLDWVPGGVRFTDADDDGSPRTESMTIRRAQDRVPRTTARSNPGSDRRRRSTRPHCSLSPGSVR